MSSNKDNSTLKKLPASKIQNPGLSLPAAFPQQDFDMQHEAPSTGNLAVPESEEAEAQIILEIEDTINNLKAEMEQLKKRARRWQSRCSESYRTCSNPYLPRKRSWKEARSP